MTNGSESGLTVLCANVITKLDAAAVAAVRPRRHCASVTNNGAMGSGIDKWSAVPSSSGENHGRVNAWPLRGPVRRVPECAILPGD